MKISLQQILLIVLVIQLNVIVYTCFSANLAVDHNYLDTLERIVSKIDDKIRRNKLDELNLFEKWIIRFLVKRNIEKKVDVIDQKEFWTFRQG